MLQEPLSTAAQGPLTSRAARRHQHGQQHTQAESLRGALTDAPAGTAAVFDLRTADAAGQVLVETDVPGPVSGEFWLHNGGPDDMGKIRLRCSDLLANDGALIESGCVRFEPDMVAMPARSSLSLGSPPRNMPR